MEANRSKGNGENTTIKRYPSLNRTQITLLTFPATRANSVGGSVILLFPHELVSLVLVSMNFIQQKTKQAQTLILVRWPRNKKKWNCFPNSECTFNKRQAI